MIWEFSKDYLVSYTNKSDLDWPQTVSCYSGIQIVHVKYFTMYQIVNHNISMSTLSTLTTENSIQLKLMQWSANVFVVRPPLRRAHRFAAPKLMFSSFDVWLHTIYDFEIMKFYISYNATRILMNETVLFVTSCFSSYH